MTETGEDEAQVSVRLVVKSMDLGARELGLRLQKP